MEMGQVWSKADFDGRMGFGNHGGRGSVIAVTTQNAGPDGVFGTADDVLAPLNPLKRGVQTSVDTSFDNADNNPNDRVREFASLHPGGANFLFTDGSVRFVRDSLDFRVYQALGSIQGGEVVGDY
jgi:prepilin-type processing-associated H-X9-DG protein